MNGQIFMLELRKKKDNVILKVTENMLQSDPNKILQILIKECVDLKTWFYIIVRENLFRSIFSQSKTIPISKNSRMSWPNWTWI
jgi:hypothetical protein